MITYVVKKGDNLSKIAYKYQTTVSILVSDNPIITDRNLIFPGWRLKVRTAEEYARDKSSKAKESKNKASIVDSKKNPTSANLTTPTATVEYQGQKVSPGQIGIVTLVRNAYVYTFGTKGELNVFKTVKRYERYKVYGEINRHGGMYNVGVKMYVKKTDVRYERLPDAYIPSTSVGTSVLTTDNPKKKEKTSGFDTSVATIPQFQMPGYRRTRMKVKKPDGNTMHMEMRILSMNTQYSNQYSPSRSNAGFSVHVGGRNLTTLNFSGFLLDSRANREVDKFMEIYEKYLTPKSDEKYFSSKIISILHKNREYKGLITSLVINDDSSQPIDRKFSMQFLVLSEKALDATAMEENWKLTVSREGQAEVAFRSSLKGMLSNPMTGDYNTKFATHN